MIETKPLSMFKCELCKHILQSEDLIEGKCPECHTEPVSMCSADIGSCKHPGEDQFGVLKFCPICGAACCPICNSHDIEQISRITGYLSAISGWGNGKVAELKDRVHYDALTGDLNRG
jgi:hypothetical protein